MLFISILLTVWFVVFLYFAKRKDEMLQLIISFMCDVDDEIEKEEEDYEHEN